ncbi:MAG: PD40 domain-containing protein [Bacteroidales bacterium]|nr:PD40 domain-containing protein [Bacteroidales bacterium]
MRSNLLITFLLITNCFLLAAQNPLWMRYPALSPDGQTIVFSYQGDLYKAPASGGPAVSLTVHSAYDFNPVWSPDGTKIAFASTRYGNFDLFVIPAEGGKAIRVTDFSGNEFPNTFTPNSKEIIYSASIQDVPENVMFPSGLLSELYAVTVEGGRPRQILSVPAEKSRISSDGNRIIFQDRKGYENTWRKHHTSSVARDIWVYDQQAKSYQMLTTFEGEDQNPVFSVDEREVYFLSEKSGSLNVWKMPVDNPANLTQLTTFEHHPVRFLSIGANDRICFGYDGEIYIKDKNSAPRKVQITLSSDDKQNPVAYKKEKNGAGEMAVSPDGKEIAFVLRGEIFVTSTDFATTRRITKTPEQERSVSFSPDGRKLLYAGERDGSWNVYQTSIAREEDPSFSRATILKEEVIIATDAEEFQPLYSPDGKEVAYLHDRETLNVINLESKVVRTVLDGKYNYSYADGDQWFQWSPDGKWFLVNFSPNSAFMDDVGLVSADGTGEVNNLTMSGYSDNRAKWMMKGEMMIWFSDRQGLRSHGSWGAQYDVYAMFFDPVAWDKFNLSEEEKKILKDKEEEEKKKEGENKTGKPDKKKEDADKKEEIKPVNIILDGLEDRRTKLTINSSSLADAVLTPDGEKLYYLSRFEKGFDLWVNDLVKKETKLLLKLEGGGGAMQLDKKGENLYMISGRDFIKVNTKDNKKDVINYDAEMVLDLPGERAYMFEHAWRQVREKFYDPTLHGIDWNFYKKEYEKFLPHINNNFDYAEMLSELLGELNASHTGSGYRHSDESGDMTASLGVLLDWSYRGDGLKIAEVLEKGPLDNAESKAKPGTIIEQINGDTISAGESFFGMVNRLEGKPTRLSFYNLESGERWEELMKPISFGQQNALLYDRWVKTMRQKTEVLSGGRLGYVHVRGMDSESFRVAYSEILGRNHTKEAVIIDTRFNGGGWLHNDLAVLLSGQKYVELWPNGRYYGLEPMNQWTKPSVVIMGESNYSDAHFFPFTYSALNIGKTVGMPVPGTATAVWWETLLDPTLYFGIPQVGVKDLNGNYLENQQLEPDIKQQNDYDKVVTGIDQQLEKAVEYLLELVDEK